MHDQLLGDGIPPFDHLRTLLRRPRQDSLLGRDQCTARTDVEVRVEGGRGKGGSEPGYWWNGAGVRVEGGRGKGGSEPG